MPHNETDLLLPDLVEEIPALHISAVRSADGLAPEVRHELEHGYGLLALWRHAVAAQYSQPDYYISHFSDSMDIRTAAFDVVKNSLLATNEVDYDTDLSKKVIKQMQLRLPYIGESLTEVADLHAVLTEEPLRPFGKAWAPGGTSKLKFMVQPSNKDGSPPLTGMKSIHDSTIERKTALFMMSTNVVQTHIEAVHANVIMAGLTIMKDIVHRNIGDTTYHRRQLAKWAEQLRNMPQTLEPIELPPMAAQEIYTYYSDKIATNETYRAEYPDIILIDQLSEKLFQYQQKLFEISYIYPPRSAAEQPVVEQLEAMEADYLRLRTDWGMLDKKGLRDKMGKLPYRKMHLEGAERYLSIQMTRFALGLEGALRDTGAPVSQAITVQQDRLAQALEQDYFFSQLVRQAGGPDGGEPAAKILSGAYTMVDTVEALRQHWPEFSDQLERAKPGVNLSAVQRLLFPRGKITELQDQSRYQVVLDEYELSRRQLVRDRLMHLFEIANIVDLDILAADPQMAPLNQEASPSKERRAKALLHKFNYDPSRIVLIYALQAAYAAELTATGVFQTNKSEVPFIVATWQDPNTQLWYSVAECPIYDRATYFHLGAHKESWQEDLNQLRSEAIKLANVTRMKHITHDPLVYVDYVKDKLCGNKLALSPAAAERLSGKAELLMQTGFDDLFPLPGVTY